jgi:hypothetical protein
MLRARGLEATLSPPRAFPCPAALLLPSPCLLLRPFLRHPVWLRTPGRLLLLLRDALLWLLHTLRHLLLDMLLLAPLRWLLDVLFLAPPRCLLGMFWLLLHMLRRWLHARLRRGLLHLLVRRLGSMLRPRPLNLWLHVADLWLRPCLLGGWLRPLGMLLLRSRLRMLLRLRSAPSSLPLSLFAFFVLRVRWHHRSHTQDDEDSRNRPQSHAYHPYSRFPPHVNSQVRQPHEDQTDDPAQAESLRRSPIVTPSAKHFSSRQGLLW